MARPTARGPKFVRYFGPVLEALRALGYSGTPAEVRERVAKDLNLSDAELTETSSSGQTRFDNRVNWARFYLVKEGLIDGSERGVWRLTERGRNKTLDQAAALEISKRQHANIRIAESSSEIAINETNASKLESEEEIEAPAEEISTRHREPLARLLKNMSAKGFEHFSALVLRKAGFTEVNVTGRANDGGIDGNGYLRINPMMTLRVLFQCKKYSNSVVPKDDIMKFQAAVLRERAEKGLFLTTSIFTKGARAEALGGACEIELIDIQRLIELIETFKLGLNEQRAFIIDETFFGEFLKD